MRSTRAIWRDNRFSSRVGEQIPDAHYACSLERPKPRGDGLLIAIAWLGFFFICLTAPWWWHFFTRHA